MIRIALTGSIGMGKSTVARMFEDAGVPVFDADRAVRDLQSADQELIAAIGAKFPETVRNGELDRESLRAAVLGRPAELQSLEEIVHPVVEAARERFVTEHRDSPALLFDIPLLFETGGAAAFDKVITVSAPVDVQRRRVLVRPGMTPDRLDAILARQLPDEEKCRRSDFVIDNGGDLVATKRQVEDILTCLGLPTGR